MRLSELRSVAKELDERRHTWTIQVLGQHYYQSRNSKRENVIHDEVGATDKQTGLGDEKEAAEMNRVSERGRCKRPRSPSRTEKINWIEKMTYKEVLQRVNWMDKVIYKKVLQRVDTERTILDNYEE